VDAALGVSGFDDLQILQRGANTLIRLEPGGEDTLLLFNTDATSLTADDFVFEGTGMNALFDNMNQLEGELSDTSTPSKIPEFNPGISDYEIEEDMIDSFYDAGFAYA